MSNNDKLNISSFFSIFGNDIESIYDDSKYFSYRDFGDNILLSEDVRVKMGNKGAGLIAMANIGIPIPPGIILSTDLYSVLSSHNHDDSYTAALYCAIENEFRLAIKKIEKLEGKIFGDGASPLFLSVRSGAAVSMPGMMETILNIGLNDVTVEGLARLSCNPVFAYDSYCRLMRMYAETVAHIDRYEVDKIFFSKNYRNIFYRGLANIQNLHSLHRDANMDSSELYDIISNDSFTANFVSMSKDIIGDINKLILSCTRDSFSQDPYMQIVSAIKSVIASWNCAKARKYREINGISESLGTAIVIQSMVFGNLSDKSATGVVFTRDPANGSREIFGEFLPCAQGEAVVSGEADALPINEYSAQKYYTANVAYVASNDEGELDVSMEKMFPDIFKELLLICEKLERYYCDMQDIEFTIENGKLWILQTRSGKRTPAAALKIACDLLKEGFDVLSVLKKIDYDIFEKLLHPYIDRSNPVSAIASGLPASPGAASGRAVFNSEKAEIEARDGNVILVRSETSPEDIAGMHVAQGIVTARGGMTSHAAVVARSMGRPCVCGVRNIDICGDYAQINLGDKEDVIHIKEGDWLTIDGTTGEVFLGQIPMIKQNLSEEFFSIINCARERKRMAVYMNAETDEDIAVGIRFIAEGIGLCRTEHMFFEKSRIMDVRAMILLSAGGSDCTMDRTKKEAVNRVMQHQIMDFKNIFKAMPGRDVVIRLLDPPLHEFLPSTDDDIDECAVYLGIKKQDLHRKIDSMRECNPMLGHRGVRLGITNPEIYQMQIDAIIDAYSELYSGAPICSDNVSNYGESISSSNKEHMNLYSDGALDCISNIPPNICIMMPFVSTRKEVLLCRDMIKNRMKEKGCNIKYQFGVMIELPRIALIADSIAEDVDFVSFGTNDLTQTTIGLSRDDAHSFLGNYVNDGIFTSDPFVSIDIDGVGSLIRIAVEKIRRVNPFVKIGVCGEHGSDKRSIEFFESIGIDYISCSPYRIPRAQIAAAVAHIYSCK